MPKCEAEGGSGWAAGDCVLVNGRAAVVTKDMRPKHNRATVKWSDTGELEKKIDADTIQPRGNQAEEPSAKHSKIEPGAPQSHNFTIHAPAERHRFVLPLVSAL